MVDGYELVQRSVCPASSSARCKSDLDAQTKTCSLRPKLVRACNSSMDTMDVQVLWTWAASQKFRPGQAWMQTNRHLKRRTGSIEIRSKFESRDGQKWAPQRWWSTNKLSPVMRGPTGAAKSRAPRGNRDHPQRNSRPAQGPIAITGQGAHRNRRCKTAACDIVQQDMLYNGGNGGNKEMDLVMEQLCAER